MPAFVAPGILLAADSAEKPSDGPRWIQIGRTGEWHGHRSGPFRLTREDLSQIVANFRANPTYQAGTDGCGARRVVAYDFAHASEAPPAQQAIVGAPAQAWALDLEVRDAAGESQLWALTEYLEPARSYVREGRYQWVSMGIDPAADDPVTGKAIGWRLSSVAFTNDPFIQGMIPIAASRREAQTAPEPGQRGSGMDLMQRLAARLKCAATEQDVEDAAAAATESKSKIAKFTEAMQVKTLEEALAKFAAMAQQVSEINAAMPELAALATSSLETEEASAKDDVEQVMASMRSPEADRPMLTLLRTGGLEIDRTKPLLSLLPVIRQRREARERFLAARPKAREEERHLLAALATAPAAAPGATPRTAERPLGAHPQRLDLSAYAGRNDFERAMTLARSQNPNASFEALHRAAHDIVERANGGSQ